MDHEVTKSKPYSIYNQSDDVFRFLSKGAILTPEVQINSDGSAANPWRLSSMQKVEEVKCVIRVIPIWAAGIIYYVALVQQSTYVVFQALQSDRRLGSTGFKIPAASYTVFTMLSLTIWIPIYDQIIVPLLRRLTGKEVGITLLQKMGIGMVLAVITMILSALVEERRRTLALTKATVGIEARRGAISSLSGMWLVPQLTLIGISEGLTIIGQVEFFYKQFPENMRSFAGAFLFCGIAFSNYLSSFLVSIVHQSTGGTATGNWLPEDLNKGRLDYFYYLVAALGMVNLLYFLACAKWYKYKDSEESPLEVSLEKMQPQNLLFDAQVHTEYFHCVENRIQQYSNNKKLKQCMATGHKMGSFLFAYSLANLYPIKFKLKRKKNKKE